MKRFATGGVAALAVATLAVAVPTSARPPALVLGSVVRIVTPGLTPCPAEGEPEITSTALGTWVAYNDDHQCPWLPTMTRIEEVQLITKQGKVTFIPLDAPTGQLVSGDPDLSPAPDGGVYLSALWSGAPGQGSLSLRILHIDNRLHVHALPTPSFHGTNNFDDKEFIAVDDRHGSRYRGRLYVAWDDLSGSGVTVVRAWDGRRWLPPAKIGTSGAPDVAVGPHGEVAVVWQTPSGISLRVSHDGGRHFTPATSVITGSDPGYIDPSCPLRATVGVRQRTFMGGRVAYDRAGDMHVVASVGHWQDTSSADAAEQGLLGAAQIRHVVLHDGRIVRSESVTPPTTDEQWMGDLAPLPGGGVAVSWLQTNAPGYTTYDAWIAAEPAGSHAFTTPQKLSLTSSKFPAATEAVGNSNCYGIGDYLGMVGTKDGVVTAWPTTDTDLPGVDSDVLVRSARLR